MAQENKTDRMGNPLKSASPLLKEFRDFAMRGNVIDLAVGVVIGAAFGKIVDALVTSIIMPPLSLVTGKVNLQDQVIQLTTSPLPLEEARAKHIPMISYGMFLNAVLSFLIVSFSIFMVVRLINKLHRKPEAPVDKKDCPFCCSSISIKATRCPQCTSVLDGSAPVKT